MAAPVHLNGHRIVVSASIEAVTGHLETADALLTRADAAMYGAKRGGRGRVVTFTEDGAFTTRIPTDNPGSPA